jgi:hypothetical protein
MAPLPGYPSRQPAPRKKQRTVYTFTSVAVAIVDAKTAVEIWTGAGAGVSRNPDPRITSQLPLWSVMQQFPLARSPELLTGSAGVPGLHVEIFTNDGAHYFPAVTGVDPGSPCWRTGIKRLDMILAMDAESTADQPYVKFAERLAGTDNSSITMTIWREGDQSHISVPREPVTAKYEASVPVPVKGEKPKTPDLGIPRTVPDYKQSVPILGGVILLILTAAAIAGGS